LQLVVIGIGLGGGVLNGGTNALVADISEEEGRSASLSLLGVFFGLGAFGMPFVLGFLLEQFAYGTLIAWVGGVVLLPVVYMMAITFPAPKQAQGFPIKDAARLIRDPLLILMGLMLFIQSGIEITASGWVTTYFHEEMGLRADHAAFFLSLFWLGMILARLLLGVLLRRISPGVVLRAFIAVSGLAGILLVASPNVWVAAPAVFLIGAGLAAGFPILLGYAGDRYATLSGTAYSILFVMALAGGSILPYLTGIVAEAADLRTAFLLIPAVLAVMFMLLLVVLRRMKGEGTT
jgi:MFS transporter, FHS family, glucose/mannose:H+ symporter